MQRGFQSANSKERVKALRTAAKPRSELYAPCSMLFFVGRSAPPASSETATGAVALQNALWPYRATQR